jgi:tol-pal system protein YbgF
MRLQNAFSKRRTRMSLHPLLDPSIWQKRFRQTVCVAFLVAISSSFFVGLPVFAQSPYGSPSLSEPTDDLSDAVVRINRLENQIRQLSGQLEESKFENRRLSDQLKRLQEDIDFRLQDLEKKRSEVKPKAADTKPVETKSAEAPQPLSTSRPSEPLPRPAATSSGEARTAYDFAYAFILQKNYPEAERALAAFVKEHARDALVPDALFWLGDAQSQQNNTRAAIESFLKITTDYPNARLAPNAFVRLGRALGTLNAKEQACNALAQVNARYPQAAATVKRNAEAEQKKLGCAS